MPEIIKPTANLFWVRIANPFFNCLVNMQHIYIKWPVNMHLFALCVFVPSLSLSLSPLCCSILVSRLSLFRSHHTTFTLDHTRQIPVACTSRAHSSPFRLIFNFRFIYFIATNRMVIFNLAIFGVFCNYIFQDKRYSNIKSQNKNNNCSPR